MPKSNEKGCFAALASCCCGGSAGSSGNGNSDQQKGTKVFHTPNGATSSSSVSPLGPFPGLRREELVIERTVPLSMRYNLGNVTGSGAYGEVIFAKSKQTDRRCAVKSMKLAHHEEDCRHEVEIAWKLVHPYIAQVFEVFQDSTHIRIVMEICDGGSLYDWVVAGVLKRGGTYRECYLLQHAFQMLAGIAYLHSHAFTHRDVKPTNYLLQNRCKDSSLKLIDMGFACPVERGVPLTLRVGTVDCAAPEVAKGSYDEKCDIWSMGIVLYFCCVGYCPFEADPGKHETPADVLKKVVRNAVGFDMEDWAWATVDLRTLIQDMLIKDPRTRPSAEQLASKHAKLLTWALSRAEASKPSSSLSPRILSPQEIPWTSSNDIADTSRSSSKERLGRLGASRIPSNDIIKSASNTVAKIFRHRGSSNHSQAADGSQEEEGHTIAPRRTSSSLADKIKNMSTLGASKSSFRKASK